MKPEIVERMFLRSHARNCRIGRPINCQRQKERDAHADIEQSRAGRGKPTGNNEWCAGNDKQRDEAGVSATEPVRHAVTEHAACHRAECAEQQLQRADASGDAVGVHPAFIHHPQLHEREAGERDVSQHEANNGEAKRAVVP
ncbi:hypothetical protein ACTMU2_40800 [Cupriavidus basilensis]